MVTVIVEPSAKLIRSSEAFSWKLWTARSFTAWVNLRFTAIVFLLDHLQAFSLLVAYTRSRDRTLRDFFNPRLIKKSNLSNIAVPKRSSMPWCHDLHNRKAART